MKYSQTIERIHNEFNTASDRLLSEAKEILNGQDVNPAKASRLASLGFTQSKDVKKWDDVKVTNDMAETIMYYQQKYPNNKFITEEQVVAINKKYNLVCAPVDRYKGFVPNAKLDQIEKFCLKMEDERKKIALNIKWSCPNLDEEIIKRLKKKYFDGKFPVPEYGSIEGASVRSYDLMQNNGLFICAPQKDMDLKGLSKIGAIMTSLLTVNVPDPVVLQPVKKGYLILAAWGEEASDPIVVNQQMN